MEVTHGTVSGGNSGATNRHHLEVWWYITYLNQWSREVHGDSIDISVVFEGKPVVIKLFPSNAEGLMEVRFGDQLARFDVQLDFRGPDYWSHSRCQCKGKEGGEQVLHGPQLEQFLKHRRLCTCFYIVLKFFDACASSQSFSVSSSFKIPGGPYRSHHVDSLRPKLVCPKKRRPVTSISRQVLDQRYARELYNSAYQSCPSIGPGSLDRDDVNKLYHLVLAFYSIGHEAEVPQRQDRLVEETPSSILNLSDLAPVPRFSFLPTRQPADLSIPTSDPTTLEQLVPGLGSLSISREVVEEGTPPAFGNKKGSVSESFADSSSKESLTQIPMVISGLASLDISESRRPRAFRYCPY